MVRQSQRSRERIVMMVVSMAMLDHHHPKSPTKNQPIPIRGLNPNQNRVAEESSRIILCLVYSMDTAVPLLQTLPRRYSNMCFVDKRLL